MKMLAVVQARYSSTRLPGKVLKKIGDKVVLEMIMERLNQSRCIDEVVIATSNKNSDNVIEDFCKKYNFKIFRGSLDDVLERFYMVALKYKAENILRITGDCPFIDYGTIDEIIINHCEKQYDYFGLGGDFPDGLDCTCFSFKALKESYLKAELPSEREHIGQYIENNAGSFKTGEINKFQQYKNLRITLDEPEDLELLNRIIMEWPKSLNILKTENVLGFLEKKLDLIKINQHISRNEGLKKSLKYEESRKNE